MKLESKILLAIDKQQLSALSIARVASLNWIEALFLNPTIWKMEDDGLLEREMRPDAWNERNGNRRAFYKLTDRGLKILNELTEN